VLGRVAFRSPVRPLRLAEVGEPMLAIAATFAVYGLAQLAGGYGFLSVFVAALAIRAAERGHRYHADLHRLTEQLELILTLAVLLLLGASLTSGLLTSLTWGGALVAVALVLVIRPLFGWLSLGGHCGLGPKERWVTAVFGVRGIGSIYYLAFAAGQATFPEVGRLWSTVGFAIVLSVVVHGIGATPVMAWLERRRQRTGLSMT
jgi:NhaP-type Na+/H+ or K+/H+ antiporter